MIVIDRKVVYIASPVMHRTTPAFEDLEQYRKAYALVEQELYALGAWFVFNPCEYWRKEGDTLPPWPRAEFMRADLHMLTSGTPSKRQFDLVVLLEGYPQSEGACTELIVAMACGIPVLSMAEIKTQSLKDFWEGK